MTKVWSVHFYQQWGAVFTPSRWNWIDFTFLRLEVEHSPYKSSSEITFGLLGLNLTIERALRDAPPLDDKERKP